MPHNERKKRKYSRYCWKCLLKHGKPTGQNCDKPRALVGQKSPPKAGVSEDMNKIEEQAAAIEVLKEQNAKLLQALEGKKDDGMADNEALKKENERLLKELEEKSKEEPTDKGDVGAEIKRLVSIVTAMHNNMEEMKGKVEVLSEEREQNKQSTASVIGDQAQERTVDDVISGLEKNLGLDSSHLLRGGCQDIAYLQEEDEKKRGKRLISGRELTAESTTVRRVMWPHTRILKHPENKGPKFEVMTAQEFSHGFTLRTDEEPDVEVRACMKKHLNEMLEDITSYPNDWPSLRSYHALILSNIERGILGWADKEQMGVLRQKYVFSLRPITASNTPCPEYNDGGCGKKREHDGLVHMCSHCHATLGKELSHARTSCYRLFGPPRQTRQRQEEAGKAKS